MAEHATKWKAVSTKRDCVIFIWHTNIFHTMLGRRALLEKAVKKIYRYSEPVSESIKTLKNGSKEPGLFRGSRRQKPEKKGTGSPKMISNIVITNQI